MNPEPAIANRPSAVRAWFFLVWLSWQRQARARQMVWIALGLLAFTAAIVAVNTAGGWWDMHNWRWVERKPGAPPAVKTYRDAEKQLEQEIVLSYLVPRQDRWTFDWGLLTTSEYVMRKSPFQVFTNWFVFVVFLSFLLPLLSLSFATEAIGGERETNSIVWLLTRPMPRPAIYLAKFVALLPWSFALNVGGFALLCLLGGEEGRRALRLFWPAVVWATLAFAALFYFIGACFRRPAVVAIVYSFFLETILGNMPGYMKRVSINFYVRCMMYDAAESYGIQPDRPTVFLPVNSATALATLVAFTIFLLAIGTIYFSRAQYQDAV